MKPSVAKRYLFDILMALPVLLCACSVYENGPQQPAAPDDGMVPLAIHIAAVSTPSGSANDYFDSEKIKSLRIILVGTDNTTSKDTIEFNKLIQVQNGGVPASEFQYDYVWRTKPGSKRFYILANEESVTSISYDTSGGLSAPSFSSLGQLLNQYAEGAPAGDLLAVMNSIYFTPNYGNMGGDVYLPYSSMYEDILIGERDVQNVTMYVVPVATKFIFNFTNKRQAAVNVTGITLSYTNTQNYLLGQVGSTDFNKDLEGVSYYWVDWLAQISALSHNFPGNYPNINFNNTYGWIYYYDLPSELNTTSVFVAQSDNFVISGSENYGTDDAVPGYNSAGPFYVPESKNFINPEKPNSTPAPGTPPVQSYYFTIEFEDTADGKMPPEVTNVAIENLKALFRNTYCIINIVISQGEVKVYAEIAEWNQKSIQGWVTEGQAPPGLTFP